MGFKSALARIVDAGFTGCDLMMSRGDFCPHYHPWEATEADRQQTVDAVASAGLSVFSLNTSLGQINALGSLGHEDYRATYIETFRLAQALAAPLVTVGAGASAPEERWAEDLKVIVAEYGAHVLCKRRIAGYADDYIEIDAFSFVKVPQQQRVEIVCSAQIDLNPLKTALESQ